MDNFIQQRAYPRIIASLPVDLSVPGRTPPPGSLIVNVSEGGLFVHTPELFDVGSRIGVSFAPLVNEMPVRGAGIVVWSAPRPQSAGVSGLGVRLCELDKAARRILLAFLERHMSPW
jgi:Tfp pilus assembly protein PilZ